MVAPDDPRLAKVGFAKLVGSGVELYAKKHEITMGRLSKSGQVDVVLGGWRVGFSASRILVNASCCKSMPSLLLSDMIECLNYRRKHEHLTPARQNSVQPRLG